MDLADKVKPSTSNTDDKQKSDKHIEKDKCNNEKLDPTSEKFDSKYAIYCNDELNVGNCVVKTYDNIEDCIKAFNVEKRNMKNNIPTMEEDGVRLERCFAPEQMMVATKRSKATFRDINIRMKAYTTGPLAQLQKWRLEKTRVKIWTRSIDQIRGFSTGFIAAFDKHWNLALTDVDEHFHRKRVRKTWGDAGKRCPPKYLPSDLPVEIKIGSSLMRIIKIEGKYESCVRHVPQVILRGEHVVMVAKHETLSSE